ncbi:hypothetical protein M3610_05095 [Neobacillus sp. MER 74]|uniref:hypothetical protein n=1 Tax=Bacillaceae TaxID=186817 RepID=UPI000BF9D6EA|nr:MULTISPECIES: hypothetical protein [Bacillaceae]MCM3114657.1 hypothetical protein [Neobacillus sp. MER 74]PFP27320.1 hypothetical protein COJ96_16075 [Bacillus sp. AFS073361]
MFIKVIKYFVIFICGYILIKWISIPQPFALSDFFISLVVNPLKFFAATLVFFIGFLLTGRVLSELIVGTKIAWQKRKVIGVDLLIEYLYLLIVFCLLFYLGLVQTIAFFSLSLFYGMISIER